MSFNDLERGTSGSASQSRSSGNNPPVGHRSGRPTSTGPLPLYHAPRSATGSSSYSDDNSAQDANATGLTPEQRAEFKRLADSVGTQIFKITSNTQAIQKLVRLADQQQRKREALAKALLVPDTAGSMPVPAGLCQLLTSYDAQSKESTRSDLPTVNLQELERRQRWLASLSS